MEKRESKTVAATKRRITDGLFEIMKNDPIERITVREVCGRAGIARSTFYAHFSSVYDVRETCEAEISERAEGVLFPTVFDALGPKGEHGGCEKAARRIEEALGDHFDHLTVLLNGGDPSFVERARLAAMDAVSSHLGLENMSERQASSSTGRQACFWACTRAGSHRGAACRSKSSSRRRAPPFCVARLRQCSGERRGKRCGTMAAPRLEPRHACMQGVRAVGYMRGLMRAVALGGMQHAAIILSVVDLPASLEPSSP
jgi:AcrR family transcriptional regulator